MKSTLKRVKAYLKTGRSISTLQGLTIFGTMRLSEYIRILRHDHGMDIECEIIYNPRTKKRYGLYYERKKKKK